MGWTTPKSSKRRRTISGKRLFSILTCCSFTTAEKSSRQDSHLNDTLARRTNSNQATPSQTITCSTTSIASKEVHTQSNAPASTIQKPSLEQQHPMVKRDTTYMDTALDPQKEDLVGTMDQETSSSFDVQVTTTPSLDVEQDLWLLGPVSKQDRGRKCLVLDLDETLVHSSFKVTPQADFVVPVEIDGSYHNVFVLKRPGVDAFMKRMGELYEVVVFTASLSKYADPVLDTFDIHRAVQHRLFRESCFYYKGTYVKDLSQLGRQLNQVIILDNSPASYIFHTANAVPVSSWFNDPHDSELFDLIPFLEDLATSVDDITDILDNTIPGPFSHF